MTKFLSGVHRLASVQTLPAARSPSLLPRNSPSAQVREPALGVGSVFPSRHPRTVLLYALDLLVRFFTNLFFPLFPAGRRRQGASIPPIRQVAGGAGVSRVQASSTWRGTLALTQCREFPQAAGSQRSLGPSPPTCCAKLVPLSRTRTAPEARSRFGAKLRHGHFSGQCTSQLRDPFPCNLRGWPQAQGIGSNHHSSGKATGRPRLERDTPERRPVFCPLGHDIGVGVTFMSQVYHPSIVACQGAI